MIRCLSTVSKDGSGTIDEPQTVLTDIVTICRSFNMNNYLLAAGLMSFITFIGHLTYGRKHYLKPLLEAELTPNAKVMMHCVFHYVSVFIALSTVVLISSASTVVSSTHSFGMIAFIALNFGLFAIWQIYIGVSSELANPFKSIFQWLVFVLIAGLSICGILV
ncbi:hypothetical protein [Shewanella youngdeokensis]|uniref:DUF423 domain-containing protein n=1 Tax=Shewanella youngdeokensis TaxID=2999068 RepID=A0ABZ0JW99_9GAMM|nr:hypothetical protein RGE70_10845 [Shewanella sp. DAU334]